jgi:hypothetical protein
MPALGGRQAITYQFRDFTGEIKGVRMFSGEITAVSLPGLLTELGTLESALNGITLGVISKSSWGEETIVSNDVPVSKYAQIESALLVTMRGDTTEAQWSFSIPTIDANVLNFATGAGDTVIFEGAGASAQTTALVDALETTLRNPDDDSELGVVIGMRFVGRND